MSLWQDFRTNQGKVIHKWLHYFPIYEKHLAPWKNKTVTVLEIGVSKGGSLQMWSRFFGPLATVIGIDIDPQCKAHQEPDLHVRIGDQGDPRFLQSLIEEFGPPDVVIDDGSHKMGDITASFEFLYPKLSKNGVYLVEDLHTAYWQEYDGGLNRETTFIHFCKQAIDQLNADHTHGLLEPGFIGKHTFGIAFYDSVVVFERGTIPLKGPAMMGGA